MEGSEGMDDGGELAMVMRCHTRLECVERGGEHEDAARRERESM